MNHVFTYWEGPMPSYIRICLKSIRRKTLDAGWLFHLVTTSNMSRYVPDGMFHDSWKTLAYGVKSDVVRAAVLHQFGGLYLDADTVMLASPENLNVGDEDAIYAKWNRKDTAVAGYVYLKRDTAITREWIRLINGHLSKPDKSDRWMQLGEQSLTPALSKSTNTRAVPLHTFLPVDIDWGHQFKPVTEVGTDRFFTDEKWWPLLKAETICFGLNGSYMERKYPAVMQNVNTVNDGDLMIHKLIRFARRTIRPLKIGVITLTYRRPRLLGFVIDAFERQTYPYRQMIAYDNAGELPITHPVIVSEKTKYKTLGRMRNAVAQMMPHCDAFVFWDDDDLWMPWALQSVAESLAWHDWCRPSEVLLKGNPLRRLRTYAREDRKDKAFMGGWGVTKAAFNAVGGFPDLTHGEDLGLALKLLDANVSECDPLEEAEDKRPYFLYGPHDNEHISYTRQTWDEYRSKTARTDEVLRVRQPKWWTEAMRSSVEPRMFTNDWLKDRME